MLSSMAQKNLIYITNLRLHSQNNTVSTVIAVVLKDNVVAN
jgi:hypothetical protein